MEEGSSEISVFIFSEDGIARVEVDSGPVLMYVDNLKPLNSFGNPSGTGLRLGDNDSRRVTFTSDFTFPFFGTTYSEVWVNSNGTLSFTAADFDAIEEVADLEDQPLIAPFFDDLEPNEGAIDVDFYSFTATSGTVIVAELLDDLIGSELDGVLTLYDSNGDSSPKATTSQVGSWDSRIELMLPLHGQPPADGTYHLRVVGFESFVETFEDSAGPDYFYTLRLKLGGAGGILVDLGEETEPNGEASYLNPEPDLGPLNEVVFATPITIGSEIDGTIDDLSVDVFTLQLKDHFIVTYNLVPGFGIQTNTFRVTLFDDGRIEFEYDEINQNDAIVGISPGGVEATGSEFDFTADTPGDTEDNETAIYEHFTGFNGETGKDFDLGDGTHLIFTPRAGGGYFVTLTAPG